MEKFNTWFDGLDDSIRPYTFVAVFFGWLIPLLLSNLIRPHSEVTAIGLGVLGGCWIFVVGIIGLERSYASTGNRK